MAVGVRSCQDYACLFARLWSVVLYLLLWGSGCVVGRWGRVPGRTRLYCAGAADCSEDGLEPASASICERINSEFAFVKDRRRNRLAHCKANKLVGLFHNLRLLKRMQKVSYVEPAVGWTDNLEQSAVTKFEPAAAGSTSRLVPSL